jgi:uncharacterized protein YciI
MNFVVIGRDGGDAEALERRMAARGRHLELCGAMKERGEVLCAAALMDAEERMVGSVLVVDFASRRDLDAWLRIEPYVTGRVWESVEVLPCRLAPGFGR